MAKRKNEIVVKNGTLDLWLEITCDEDMVQRIEAVEGVSEVEHKDYMLAECYTVWTDARYDRDEIADEIRALAS